MLLGPGDDAAMVSAPDGRVVVSTDLLVEGRHFRRDWSSGYDVGRKAAAQNLADIAAMGAVPTAIVVGLGMPAELPVDWLDALADGFRDECAVVGASVAGGDTTRGDLVVLGVTALGDLGGRAPVTRSGARPGQVVAVAGRLGHAAAGLALLEAGWTDPARRDRPSGETGPTGLSARDRPSGEGGPTGLPADGRTLGEVGRAGGDDVESLLGEAVAAHRRPCPPYPCGPEAARLGASAMLDVSDGLLQDLGHVAAASGVRVELDSAAFAVDAPVAAAAAVLGTDPLDWVLTGGDDHALAAVFPAEVRLGPSWRVVGRVVAGRGVSVEGRETDRGGWDHFR
ncbi:thiamine-monophosphate kinase [Nonomuraea cavernae]|uniref:Thiamine-monophosphate kinase n=1 Tax=Nonomuraea cavernae TaxID=2045107 RepID=A0A917YSF8_9ACTN|nr:thiamine-monophosphate kinase [Nonomuraea cavernae]MCA2185010.1 thiamine-monophosphate kinase [Nonomuraea cavernae]GGO65140.1 thiamine-monophosphate kinase [Nonomuraea cavernae]